ncbi:hypothetical protein HMPREF1548_02795 [Clostridium sp. KLE 1755]|nr:hypothetical protein HMPREF1548_02795 [Clostridium sp. KLE 1755]
MSQFSFLSHMHFCIKSITFLTFHTFTIVHIRSDVNENKSIVHYLA